MQTTEQDKFQKAATMLRKFINAMEEGKVEIRRHHQITAPAITQRYNNMKDNGLYEPEVRDYLVLYCVEHEPEILQWMKTRMENDLRNMSNRAVEEMVANMKEQV